jgi:hypothetical protein
VASLAIEVNRDARRALIIMEHAGFAMSRDLSLQISDTNVQGTLSRLGTGRSIGSKKSLSRPLRKTGSTFVRWLQSCLLPVKGRGRACVSIREKDQPKFVKPIRRRGGKRCFSFCWAGLSAVY